MALGSSIPSRQGWAPPGDDETGQGLKIATLIDYNQWVYLDSSVKLTTTLIHFLRSIKAHSSGALLNGLIDQANRQWFGKTQGRPDNPLRVSDFLDLRTTLPLFHFDPSAVFLPNYRR